MLRRHPSEAERHVLRWLGQGIDFIKA